MTLELYLFRHGRTSWNVQGRYQGQSDIDLDDLGRAQALAVAQRCAAISPIALYTSDLRRCADVAAQVESTTGISAVRDERLRERDFGEWSGLTRAEISQRFPKEFELWQEGDENVRVGGGETSTEVTARIMSFMEIVRGHRSGAVVAISHASWIRSAVQWVLGYSISRRSLGVPGQGSVTVMSFSQDGVALEVFNDRGHLLAVEAVDSEPPSPRVY